MARLTNLNVEWVSLVNRAAVRDPSSPTEPQRFLLWKSEAGANTDPEEDPMTEDELREALAKAERERDAATAALKKSEEAQTALTARVEAIEKAAKPETEPKPEPIDKADLSPAVLAIVEKAEADAAAATARIEKAEKTATEALAKAEAEENARVTGEFIKKAETFKHLAVDAGTLGPILKAASENLGSDQVAELDRILKAAEEQVSKSGLFKEYGHAGDGRGAGSTDGLKKAQDKAVELRKADPTLSRADALKQAMRDPEIAAAYRAEIA